MKLEALNRVQGVKVLAGKGKGGKTAMVGDVFEASTAAEAKRLIDLGAAKEYVVEDKLADSGEGGGKKTTTKSAGKASGGKKASGGQKAEDGSDTADDEDLGLGE
ncbi:hypothetical protein [Marinobacter nauticus]|uniref:Uncharacterized protein n=1 Tax=Marinobacter nauticus TaxID=2743 RepID=A0A833JS00_MARNT|nr:hypothetical protein [Marinobacter nauticus]KAE8546153.1 hypothetical protein F6453_1399 [Marinobacter nauticus]